jgi:hypothetical protein
VNSTGIDASSPDAALFSAADLDTDHDARDDLLVIGLVTRSATIEPGPFAVVKFDCLPGAVLPPVGTIRCTASASNRAGVTIEPTRCSIAFR